MKTLLLSGANEEDIHTAVSILLRGGLVAVPTETVYGLAARGLDESCVRKIFAAKGRPSDNPLILHVASAADAWPLWRSQNDRARTLADALWPGPLTIVDHKSALVPDVVTAGLSRVAVRVPAHDVFIKIARGLGEPIAAPSANMSGRPSPTKASDVLESLDGRVEAVVDGGPCKFGIESTVVDVAGERPIVLRPGATQFSEVAHFLPTLETRAPGQPAHADDASPGLRHRHYAPAVDIVTLAADVSAHAVTDAHLLVRASTAMRLGLSQRRLGSVEVLPDDPGGYAQELYAALYRIERARPHMLIIEEPPHGPAWDAVRDRLVRVQS